MEVIEVQPDLLPADTVAARLSISEQTLANWRATGRYARSLPHVKIGAAVRYRAADVERVIAEGLTPTSPQAA